MIRIFENDNFIVDYDEEKKKYRVSTFEDYHYCDECEFEEYKRNDFPSCSVGDIVWYTRPEAGLEPEQMKISMLQQKADKSWKVRLTTNCGSVFDIRLSIFDEYCFKTESEAKKFFEERRRR